MRLRECRFHRSCSLGGVHRYIQPTRPNHLPEIEKIGSGIKRKSAGILCIPTPWGLCREPDRAGSRGRRLRFQAQPRCLAGRGQRGARRGDAQIYPIGRAARRCDGRQPVLRGADIRSASRFLRSGVSCPFAANDAKLCLNVLFYSRREYVFKIFSYFWQDKNFENECVGL